VDISKTATQTTGLSLWTFLEGTEQIRCDDCNAWAHAGPTARIRHSKRCATPGLQPALTSSSGASAPTTIPRSGNGLTSDELLAAVQRRHLTMNQAMNTDF